MFVEWKSPHYPDNIIQFLQLYVSTPRNYSNWAKVPGSWDQLRIELQMKVRKLHNHGEGMPLLCVCPSWGLWNLREHSFEALEKVVFSPWPLSAMKSTDEMGMTMMPTMRSATARLMMNMLDTVCSRFSVLATSHLYCPLHPDTQLPDGVEHHPVTHRRHAGQQQQRQAQHQPVRLGIRSGWEYSLGFIFSLHKLSIHESREC